MATTETWVLDGVALTSGNFDILELAADPPKARFDWITAADSENAALMRQPLHENRTITMKLRVAPQASMNAALDQVGAIRDKLRLASSTSDGVALVWTPANSTRSVTFDVLAGEIPEMPIGLDGHAWSWFKQRPIFTIELTAKPYWRGSEVLSSTTTAATPLITHVLTATAGDIPALGRLIVTDAATQNRRTVEWGLEAQNYTPGSSLILESDSLITSGFAGVGGTRTGAYDPGAAGNNVVTLATTPATPVTICGTGVQTHLGTFRVRGRFWLASPRTQYVRLKWRVGDGPYSANGWAMSPVGEAAHWAELDLGTIAIPPALVGSQTWDGQVEAFSTFDATPLATDVDYLMMTPMDSGYGIASSPYSYQPPPALAGRDEFTGITAGTVLNARVAPLGGTWATAGDGTAIDFAAVDITGGAEAEKRAVASEAGVLGLYALLGATTYTDVETGVRVWRDVQGFTGGTITQAVIARFVDANNLFRLQLGWLPGGDPIMPVQLVKRVAGTTTVIAQTTVALAYGVWYRLRVIVYSSGRCVGQLLDSVDQAVLASLESYDSVLATGGALATGKVGFKDHNPSVTAVERYYDDFYVAAPTAEPTAVYSTRSMQVRYDTTVRTNSAGTTYGVPSLYRGSRFTIPPGDSRVTVIARRAALPSMPADNVTDSTSVQVGVTPRGLVVPR